MAEAVTTTTRIAPELEAYDLRGGEQVRAFVARHPQVLDAPAPIWPWEPPLAPMRSCRN